MENEGAAQEDVVSAPAARPAAWLLLLALFGGNVALAIGPWFVRVADTGPVAAGFWRLFLALPFLVVLARMNGQRLGGMGGKTLALVALGAVTFALDLASWHIGIEMTRIGNATLFGNAGSIVLLFWGFIIARTLPGRLEALAIVFALAGAAILMGRSLEISNATLIGDLFSVAAGLLYAVYLLTLQGARGQFGSWSLLVWVSLFGAPVLLVIALALGEPVWPQAWGPIVGLFVLSQLVGQGLMVFSLKYFPPLVVGLALLTQPAVASIYGWLAFGEVLSGLDIVGMVLVGAALAVSRARA
ncbi:MAG: DMT family transporter [Sphingomonadales bacterium]|nr:MAG: DMT family transporter [Sphingomonadales bacterium]